MDSSSSVKSGISPVVKIPKENSDCKREKSQVKKKKRKRKEQYNSLVKSNEKQCVTIDLISDNDNDLKESQLSMSKTCLCPVLDAPHKKIKGTLKSQKTKIYNTGASAVTGKGKSEFDSNNKKTTENQSLQKELSSDGRESGVRCDMIVLSEDESVNVTKDDKVCLNPLSRPWYSLA